MNKRSADKFNLKDMDVLLGIDSDSQQNIINLSVIDLHTFAGHPFQVLDNEDMDALVNSIKGYGVLVPILVRVRKEGGYEIISGHRRKRASELAGKMEVPAIIKNISDDEAIMAMVDSNIQRENLLFSEKAFAYKMKLEALKHQGTSCQLGTNLSVDIISSQNDDSSRQIYRYVRLTKLIKPLLDLVDAKKIAFVSAVDIAELSEIEQEWLYLSINNTYRFPTVAQAESLKRYSKLGELTEMKLAEIMTVTKKKAVQVTLVSDRIGHYFPKSYTKQEMENVIYELLEEWKLKRQQNEEGLNNEQ